MKKILWILVLGFSGCLGYTKFINQNASYPWEYFRSYPAVENTIAWKSHVDCWENFRLNYPYHIQTIGLSEVSQDGSTTIIISEPPPDFDTYNFYDVFGSIQYLVEEKTHPIGYDGWVKDVVISISGGSARQKERAFSNLYKQVFKSDYKAHYLNLSAPPDKNNKKLHDLNCAVSAAEIDNWFLKGDDQWFVDKKDGDATTLTDLLNQNKYGVYYSKNPGFVIWILPKGSINDSGEDIYKFTLDSDLALGAIAGSSSLAIIGRERKTDVFALPPLRVETVLQWAAADKSQISQSYDRMNLFAGKLPGGMDWAPIYLSDDLLNTEYGSLLNITDQMLKSWSQHGEVTYCNFMYKRPRTYPYYQSVQKEINTNVLTFNWNTKGAAYVANYGQFEIAALNRTGSLPVTFIPEGFDPEKIPFDKIRECEDKFYDFFSSRDDPNLIRVVEYAAIYQFFSAFNITADNHKNYAKYPSEDVPRLYAKQLLEAIRDKESDSAPSFARLETNQDDDGGLGAFYRMFSSMMGHSTAMEIKPKIIEFSRKFGEQGLSLLAYFLGHPRLDGIANVQYDPSSISEENISEMINWAQDNHKKFEEINDNLDQFGISRLDVRDRYVASYSATSGRWIKTPSIVLSWDADSSMATGGHNIDARMLGLSVDNSLVSGQVRVIEENGLRKVFVAASDIDKVTPAIVRELETKGMVGMQKMEGKMLGVVRDRADVIKAGSAVERGFGQRSQKVANAIEDVVEFAADGSPVRNIEINGKQFVSQTYSPYVVFPKSKMSDIGRITEAMKNRKIAEGEFNVLSFVEDESTTSALKNYCNKHFIQPEISSISDLSAVFAKNPRKTFHLVGHIEDGAIYMENKGVKLPLPEIQAAAEANNVNFMIVGCESAFENGSKDIGFANKIFSIEVAEALGTAIDASKDLWTFTHTLAKSERLRMVVYEVPIKDLGYAAAQTAKSEKIVAIVGGVALGAGAGTGLIVAISAIGGGGGGGGDDDDKKEL